MDNEDFMEIGESGLIALPGGWWLDKNSGSRISPEGTIFNAAGENIGTVSFGDNDEVE